MSSVPDSVIAALIGLLGGVLLGLAARRGRFCTLGAIEDALYGGSTDRLRMWALALAVGIAGVFGLDHIGAVDIGASIYAQQAWNPLASIAGGLIFGYGMALAGNCGYGALARAGGGDIRSWVLIVVMGIAAYMTIGGPLGVVRAALFPAESATGDAIQFGFAHGLGAISGVVPVIPALVLAGLAALWAFATPTFRNDPEQVIWSVVVGAAIVSGWWGTSWVAATGFDVTQVGSHTFTAPLGETVLYLMTATGSSLSFGIGSVTGVVIGAALGSLSKGHFRWEACDDPVELKRQIFGAALMGIGGVTALGCSVGQGLTAFSALSYSAPVVLLSIFAGAALGLRQLIHGFAP